MQNVPEALRGTALVHVVFVFRKETLIVAPALSRLRMNLR
jgi:hypothetical protein